MGADDEIAGYAVADDVSARDLQSSEAQWSRAKGFDSSCPWGPWITTSDEVDASGLRITTDVNGERRQDGSTSDLIFSPRSSSTSSPRPARWSPARSSSPARRAASARRSIRRSYLQPGDVVRVEVEGLGRSSTRCIGRRICLVRVDHAVDQAVLGGLVGLEEAVALHVLVDLLLGLPVCLA